MSFNVYRKTFQMYATQQQKKKAAETFSRGSRIGALASANWRLNETLIRPVGIRPGYGFLLAGVWLHLVL